MLYLICYESEVLTMDNELYRILEEIKSENASENTESIKYLGTISREKDTPNRESSNH